MSDAEPPEGSIRLPKDDDIFFDKDHIVFFADESGEIKCKYFSLNTDIFQDLILSVFSGALNDASIEFLIDDFAHQERKEDALSMIMVKKLLQSTDRTPVVKPSNFR